MLRWGHEPWLLGLPRTTVFDVAARVTLQARATSPDQGAVHGARRLGEDRAMMCGRESHGATAKETRGRLARGIPLIPLNPGESRFRINLWLETLFTPPTPPPRHGRTRSGHPRDRPLWRVWRKKMPGTSPGMTGEWSGLARPRASWMPGYPEQVRASPAMTLVSPRAQGARCGNIGRALGSFSNRMLARGIPLIPLNPGESRFRINVSRNPVSVSGCDASRPGHSLTPSCPDSFRASTALRRARPMEMAGYPDTRNESGQVRAGPGMTRELSPSGVDARHDGGMPGYPERVRACPGMTGEWPGWRGRAPEPEWGERRERDATATRGSPPRCAPGRG